MDSNGTLQMDKNLAEIFDIPLTNLPASTPEPKTDLTPIEPDNRSTFDFVQENLKDLIRIQMDAVEELQNIASSTEHPRAFEALSSSVKTAMEGLRTMLDNEKTQREIDKPDEGENKPKAITNNTLIVNGTTADLENKIAELMGKDFQNV